MLPHPIHRPRTLILLTLAAVAALSLLALLRAPAGQAVEYPYPYPEPTPTPPTSPTNPYPTPTPDPSPPATGGAVKRVVKVEQNGTVGHKVLTNLRGRTLYSLSAEKNGTFICDRRRLPLDLEAADRARRHEADRARPPRDDPPARRQDPGHLSRPAALQVHRGHQARRRIRRGNPGRRHLARRRGQTLRRFGPSLRPPGAPSDQRPLRRGPRGRCSPPPTAGCPSSARRR